MGQSHDENFNAMRHSHDENFIQWDRAIIWWKFYTTRHNHDENIDKWDKTMNEYMYIFYSENKIEFLE